MTKPSYRAGTPSARARAQKAADTRARQAREHEAALARRRERDRARRDEQRREAERQAREHEAALARRRERDRARRDEQRREAEQRAKLPPRDERGRFLPRPPSPLPARPAAPPRDERGRFLPRPPPAPSPVELAKAERDRAFRERIREAAKRGPRVQQARIEEGWQRWERLAKGNSPDVVVNLDSALRRGIDPRDPRAMLGFLTLSPYVSTENQNAWTEWIEDGRAATIMREWARTGILPPLARDAPVDRWLEDRHFRSAGKMVSGIFDELHVTVGAVRVDGRITDNSWGNRELVQQGSRFVRMGKTKAKHLRERRAARKHKGD